METRMYIYLHLNIVFIMILKMRPIIVIIIFAYKLYTHGYVLLYKKMRIIIVVLH